MAHTTFIKEDDVACLELVHWSAECSVDVSLLDEQHHVLFGLINELHEAMIEKNGKLVVPSILKRLLDYTRTHFSTEEDFMIRTKYPDFIEHKVAHEKLVAELVLMCREFEQGERHLSTKLLGFLRNWLRLHILNMDKQYAKHMNAAGIK